MRLLNAFTLHLSRHSSAMLFGLRATGANGDPLVVFLSLSLFLSESCAQSDPPENKGFTCSPVRNIQVFGRAEQGEAKLGLDELS